MDYLQQRLREFSQRTELGDFAVRKLTEFANAVDVLTAERDELRRKLDVLNQKQVILQGSHDRLVVERDELLARDNIKTFAEQEARIAELEAEGFAMSGRMEWALTELARVKAESLRMVKVGEPQIFATGRMVERDGFISDGEYIPGASYLAVVSPDAIIQPVRLEKWETEDERH